MLYFSIYNGVEAAFDQRANVLNVEAYAGPLDRVGSIDLSLAVILEWLLEW